MDHRYMRPPPPPPSQMPEAASDFYQRPPPPLPPPSNQPWTYSTPQQFQYHPHPQPQHSPSPPPPPQWVVPPPSSDHSQYPPRPPLPPPPPYAHQAPPYPGNPHYLPPRPPHVPQSYAQDWGSGSWSQHQSWQYPNNSSEEDWAAKARAWAAAKAVTDNQQPQSQFVSAAKPEGQHHFPNQFSLPVGPQFSDLHRPLAQASSYEQYPLETGPPNVSGLGHSQEAHYSSSTQPSYAAEIHASYAAKDGNSVAPFSQHDKSSQSPSVHQQEVPSSYSSLAGSDPGNRYEEFNSSSSQSVSQHHFQPLFSASGRSGWMEEPSHLLGSQPAESLAGLSDQPLNFAPHFNRNLDPHAQPNYIHSSGGPVRAVDPVALSSNYAWPTSSAPGAFYPPVATKMSSGPQVDHPAAMPPASGHPTTMFPTGPGFQPNVPMTGHTFGIVSGLTPHHAAFSGDAYGVSSMSERPKKASVPNWLREEIIKNKAVITSSTADLSKEETQSFDEDFNDKFSKRDQADSRSIDSSRSTEDEDEEEVEAARTAAINQEIKRILTEVLLKVTDELFDEIATRVLNEDVPSVEVSNDIDLSNHKVLPSTQVTLTPKASAKILIPKKAQEVNVDDASENSISSAGDVLGLGSYASDEEDEVIQNSGKPRSKESSKHLRSSSSKDLEDHHVSQNGSSRKLTEEQSNDPAKLKADGTGSKSLVITTANAELSNTGEARELASGDNQLSSKRPFVITEEESQRDSDSSKSNKSVTEKAGDRNERSGGSLDTIRSGNDGFRTINIKNRPDKNDEHENQKSSSLKNDTRSVSVKERPGVKVDGKGRMQEERHMRAEKTDYHNGSKDKRKVKGRTDEKTKDSESRKHKSPGDANEGTSRSGREKMHSDKEDACDRRRDKTGDEKKERSRHDTVSDSDRHKRHMSPSVDGKGRESKNNSVSHANDYSDQSSDDSKRRSRQSRRHKSPSPIRQRKRQVSRSPHSKHSKRRHSPSYSSLETTRGKRSPSKSRSRSPVHRRR